MKSRVTATSRIFGLRSTTKGVPKFLRKIGFLCGARAHFAGASVAAVLDDASRVVRLVEAAELPEEEFCVIQLEVLNLLAGTSMMSSKFCFLLACDAGMMPIAFAGRTTGTSGGEGGGGGVSSRG